MLFNLVDNNRIDICGAMPGNSEGKYWGDWHFACALKSELENKGFHARILAEDSWYERSNAAIIIVLRGKKEYRITKKNNNKIYILWLISHPKDVELFELNQFDYVFFASSKMYDLFRNRINPQSSVLLQCADTGSMNYAEKNQNDYELLYVGNSRGVYRKILEDLMPPEYKLTIYGRHWEKYPVYKYVADKYIPRDKVGQAYHDAKIVLNDHWSDMQEYGIVSNRVFDVLAAKGFVISDYMPAIDELFQGCVVTYKTKEELREKVSYYMTHKVERECLLFRGHELVVRNHTFANRVEEIIRVVRLIRRQRKNRFRYYMDTFMMKR